MTKRVKLQLTTTRLYFLISLCRVCFFRYLLYFIISILSGLFLRFCGSQKKRRRTTAKASASAMERSLGPGRRGWDDDGEHADRQPTAQGGEVPAGRR